MCALKDSHWSRWRDSNPWPLLYESTALPTELHRHVFAGRNQDRLANSALNKKPNSQLMLAIRDDTYFRVIGDVSRWDPCASGIYSRSAPIEIRISAPELSWPHPGSCKTRRTNPVVELVRFRFWFSGFLIYSQSPSLLVNWSSVCRNPAALSLVFYTKLKMFAGKVLVNKSLA